ncbi:GNAT family N-acetyltransferase [Piscinibacter sp.]|jgi:ribosomal-protein-alanine N-acetyltransferase|uniref:GNAT family N-acetyltransferase n=1 Tax=Piscinibacter sp. TaxID=1903157 RepID=UPI003559F48F
MLTQEPPTCILDTERLRLRTLVIDDAPFILELVNEPSWLRFIGDRGVRSIEQARDYIVQGPMAMFARLGFGLYLTELKDGALPIGICGLIKRDSLPDVDLGFAFLPRFWGCGYARESAAAVLAHGLGALGLKRIAAITSPDNRRSIRLLESIGFGRECRVAMADGEAEVELYAHPANPA